MASFAQRIESAKIAWEKVARVVSLVSGGTIIALMFLICADIIGRNLWNKPISGTAEATEILLPFIAFFAFGLTMILGGHVRVSMITERLPLKQKLILEAFADAVILVIMGICIYFAWLQFWQSVMANEYSMAYIYQPVWAGKIAMPIGLAVFFITAAFHLLHTITRITVAKVR